MLTEVLDHLVRGIVDHPAVAGRGETLEVRVNPDDLGRVIGRSGRTATALRKVLQALSDKSDIRIDFVDVDRGR